MRTPSSEPDTKQPSSARWARVAGVLLVILVGLAAVDWYQGRSQPITIEGRITIANPERVSIEPETCDASSFEVVVRPDGKSDVALNLVDGEYWDLEDEDACSYPYSIEVPRADSYSILSPRRNLPWRSFDLEEHLRVSEVDNHIKIEVIWEP